MKFGFIGTQCSGKTTVLWEVGAELKKMDVTAFTLIQESARKCPYPKNQEGDFKSQVWMLTKQIEEENDAQGKYRHIITDRTVYDPIVYFEYLMKEEAKNPTIKKVFQHSREYNCLEKIADAWVRLHPYDFLFLFRPLPIIGDADRPNDAIYQQKIDDIYMRRFAHQELVSIVNEETKEKRAQKVFMAIISMIGDDPNGTENE